MVKKLPRSLDNSFDTLALMIQERPDYKSLDPADILERLNTHEFQQAEKRDMYGPSYGRPHALKAKAKAKAISPSKEEEEVSECSTDDAEEIGRELAMLVRKFQKFSKRNRFGKCSKYDSKNNEASARDYDKRTCHKCKKPGHYIANCPLWKKGSKKKKSSKDDDYDDKKKKSSNSSSKSSSKNKSTSGRDRTFIGKEMDFEEESEEAEESKEESGSRVASLALTTEFVSKSIFDHDGKSDSTNSEDCADDYTPTYCFMARAESSNASTTTIASNVSVVSIPSSEETTCVTDENAGLK
nr:uncharacterized protein LOC120968753 [Aegilops tauschii subsp. strangulata]